MTRKAPCMPVATVDGDVTTMEMPGGWAVAKVTKQAEYAPAELMLLSADTDCRVLYLAPVGRITLGSAVRNGDIDWIICKMPDSVRIDVAAYLVEQLKGLPVPLFLFDSQGLIPINGKRYAQVPELLERV